MQDAKLLLIDSDESYLDLLVGYLQNSYSMVVPLTGLVKAYELLLETSFDVIIYSVSIDKSDNLAVLNNFRSHKSYPSIIAYSEIPCVSSVIEILKNGAFDYLVKPFSQERLLQSVNIGIENRKSFFEIINMNKELMKNKEQIEQEKEDLNKKNSELQTLTNITKAMTATLNLDTILYRIISGIHNIFKFDRIFISLIDYEKKLEEAKVAMGLSDNIYDETIKELLWDITDTKNNPWVDELINEKKVVRVLNPLESELYKNTKIAKYHPTTFIKVPLIAKGHVIGSLTIDNLESNRDILDNEIETVNVFADHAGIAIENAKLYENLISAHDQLKDMQGKIIESERLTAVSEIAVSVNHEINNPLCSISLGLEILKRELVASSDTVKEKLVMIDKDIDRIKEIISKLANIQSLETTKYADDIRMIDVKRSTFLE